LLALLGTGFEGDIMKQTFQTLNNFQSFQIENEKLPENPIEITTDNNESISTTNLVLKELSCQSSTGNH
jgi:hypothetical protein